MSITQHELNRWYALQQELAEIKVQEMALRKKLFNHFFLKPTEGTNTVNLGDWKVVGKYVITRTVDGASIKARDDELREYGIPLDDVIEWKPTLKIGAYRKLTKEQVHLLDQCLEIKEGSPSLQMVENKK